MSLIPKPDGDGLLTATILCPGPSLAAHSPSADDGIVIAVNRAAAFARSDWWVMLDAHTFGRTDAVGHPKILTSLQARGEVRCCWPDRAARHEFKDKGDLQRSYPDERQYMSFSFLAAVWLAVDLGCTEIACYGADMFGTADWDGLTNSKNVRTVDRWTRERMLFRKLCKALAERGVNVRQMNPVADKVGA